MVSRSRAASSENTSNSLLSCTSRADNRSRAVIRTLALALRKILQRCSKPSSLISPGSMPSITIRTWLPFSWCLISVLLSASYSIGSLVSGRFNISWPLGTNFSTSWRKIITWFVISLARMTATPPGLNCVATLLTVSATSVVLPTPPIPDTPITLPAAKRDSTHSWSLSRPTRPLVAGGKGKTWMSIGNFDVKVSSLNAPEMDSESLSISSTPSFTTCLSTPISSIPFFTASRILVSWSILFSTAFWIISGPLCSRASSTVSLRRACCWAFWILVKRIL